MARKTTKKSPAKKSPAKKSPAKKSPAKKSPAKKSVTKQSQVKKSITKKTPLAVRSVASRNIESQEQWENQSGRLSARVDRTRVLKAREAFKHDCERLCKKKNVTGVDVGLKIEGNVLTNEVVVRVHVAKKVSADSDTPLKDSDCVEKRVGADQDVPTDVIVRDYVLASSDAPLGGAAIGKKDANSFGTMGIDVLDIDDLKFKMITAAHVVSRTSISSNTQMVNSSNKVVGRVGKGEGVDWLNDSTCDFAMVDPEKPIDSVRGFLPGGPEVPVGIRRAREDDLGRLVVMLGQKTGHTSFGKLIAVNVRASAGTVSMEDHIEIHSVDLQRGPFAQRGDSGAVCVIGGQIVGMIRAVDEARGFALACQMDNVRRKIPISV